MAEAVRFLTDRADRLPFLTTKLFIPRARPNLVPRLHLAGRLNEGLHRRFTLVSAPPGFGKTTLVSTWAQRVKRPIAWLSLDEADNDLTRFLGREEAKRT